MKRILSVTLLLVLLVAGLGWLFGGRAAAQEERPATQVSEPAGTFPDKSFVHLATAENTSAAATYVDHPYLNENPNAIFFVTQNYNPAWAEVGVYNDHEVGVFYSASEEEWSIYNEDQAAMVEGAAFNVLIADPNILDFVHTTTAENITNNWTDLDHPNANGNPSAIVFTTHNYNPDGGVGEYHDHSLGVWYSKSSRWAIFNQDLVNMPVDVDFNVYVAPTNPNIFVHTATVSNTFDNWTYIDHPVTNGNPAAHVIVTQNWSVNGVYNDKAIGVWYTGTHWAIFNQDESPMPEGAAFNVRVSTKYIYLPMIQYDHVHAANP